MDWSKSYGHIALIAAYAVHWNGMAVTGTKKKRISMYVMCYRVQIIWHYSNCWNKFYPFQYFLARTKQRVYSKGNLIFRVFWLLVSTLCVQQMLWLYLISRPATAVQRIKLRESTSVCSKCVNYNFASNHPFAAQYDDGDVKSTKTKAMKWKSESIKKYASYRNSWRKFMDLRKLTLKFNHV